MDSQKLRELLRQNEGLKLEFKKILHIVDLPDSNIHKDRYRDEFVRDVLALINGNSGTANQMAYLIIGAENTLESDGTRELHDCNHITLTNKQILDKLKRFCHPPIPDLECERIDIDGKMIFVISIPPSPNVHETACDLVMPNPKKTSYPAYTTFIRRNEEIAQASIAELDAIRQEKKAWNSQISTQDNIAIDWQKVCYEMLARQKSAWQLRKKATEIGAEADVYVPLDLLEQKEKPRKNTSENAGNEKRDIDDLSKEVTKTYAHDEFLQGLTERQSKNKHIAIAGEAGAGKTTLLATIAKLLCSNGHSPIFISLADLQGESLEDYLVDHWLSQALGKRTGRTPEEIKDNFIEQLKAGNFWLLLDGLDEMGAKSPSEALGRIDREIREIIGQSRVVLTCRLNVWDAKLNNLPNFDTFRMGYFDPEQIDEFIRDWFLKAEKPELGAVLQAKLKEPNRDRIRDMVRHPLRLALLCQAFYRNPNEDLPETKAGLYDLFVRYFYEWKPNFVPEDMQTQDGLREKLHEALGNLAREGIDDSSIGFRFLRNFAVKEMGNRLFKLACDLGWLNLVERNEQDQEVYAFFHPTFQEYFAALAISNWRFFLPTSLSDLKSNDYPIFDTRWHEVIILWLGRENIKIEDKEAFINDLINFEDKCIDFSEIKCKSFYGYRAYFLAAKCLAEFNDCRNAETILEQVTKWGFGYFDDDDKDQQEVIRFLDPIQEGAFAILQKTNLALATKHLRQIIDEAQAKNEWRIGISAYCLGKISMDTKSKIIAEETLINLIKDSIDESMICQAAYWLSDIATNAEGKVIAENKLIHLMKNCADKSILCKTAYYFWGFPNDSEGKLTAKQALERLIKNSNDNKIICRAAESLGRIFTDKDSKDLAVKTLISLTEKVTNEETCCQAAKSLGIIAADKETKDIAEKALIRLIKESNDEEMHCRSLIGLGEIATNREEKELVINNLIQIMNSSKSCTICTLAALGLINVLKRQQVTPQTWSSVVTSSGTALINFLNVRLSHDDSEGNLYKFFGYYELTWHCAQNMRYPDFYKALHSKYEVRA